MDLASKLQFLDLRSSFLAGTTPLSRSLPATLRHHHRPLSNITATSSSLKPTLTHTPPLKNPTPISSKSHAVATETSTSATTLQEEEEDIEALFSANNSDQSEINHRRGKKNTPTGASSISSGVRLENEMEVAERLDKVQKAIEKSVDDLELMGRLLDEFDLLQRRAQAVNLDEVDVKISKLMPELGFAPEDTDRLVASFSGGWQMRMSLGKILLQDPDLLLLDEPTNHLDLDTIEWLECYLKKQDVPMVIISHDRAFLDQLCTKIVETDMGVSRTYEGNYSDYVIAKAAWVEAQFAAWEKQQKEIDQTRDLISRLSAGANAGRASTAEKKLEKLQDEEQVEKPFIRKQMKIRFPERGRSGRSVVTIKNLEFSYEDKAEALDLDKTVIETVAEVAEDWRLDDIKGLLGRCNFKADMLDRKVSFLSGGEKARLAFCKFMVKPSTLLVLDEPTNHLDIPTKEMLEEAINEYQGTVITVSHDRYFIKQIVNRVLEVKDGILQDYAGDYNYYLEKNLEARERELEQEAELEEKSPRAKAKSKMSKAEREARKKQKVQAFQAAKQKSKGLKNAKRWK
ncbi:hypothetical protein DH2020_047830 [Rehmannia glutinosa]|uniref:ABC transporter domain-containing protein n=1 Tax=Rehmannia glutinosa TaxID=99300 RepID=A0ABR0U7I1_REHGL